MESQNSYIFPCRVGSDMRNWGYPDSWNYKVGDFKQLFTIQSISKVFVYGQALEDHGRDYVLTKVGVEPTGEAFNAIILDKQSKCLYNPIVNAGTIATNSLIKGNGTTDS